MPDPDSILIVGASARSAAESAFRAGIEPVAIDLFGDSDLQRLGRSICVSSLNVQEFEKLRLDGLPGQFVVAGGMENRLALLEWIERTKLHIGSPIPAIAKSRDPFLMSKICRERKIRFPDVKSTDDQVRLDSRSQWLLKPKWSTGGYRIKRLASPLRRAAEDFFVQRFIKGRNFSSIFCRSKAECQLIGSSEQLIGCGSNEDEGESFAYCGSIGPIELDEFVESEIRRIGELVSKSLGLQGVFGIDWILDDGRKCWLIEINPRWTASCELFERTGVCESLIGSHVRACYGVDKVATKRQRFVSGKLVVFNGNNSLRVCHKWLGELELRRRICRAVDFADVPKVGTDIGANEPILTVFIDGESDEFVRGQLMNQANSVRDSISIRCSTDSSVFT